MKKRHWIVSLLALIVLSCGPSKKQPNIIVILTDDLGYGDVSCYGASEIITPNLDQLAAEGIRFTQGYCTSATCSPSRYALLTGQYPWKNKRAQILPGDAPLLIDPNSSTLPSMLKDAGYVTGVVGKWHLGMGTGTVDWNKEVAPGANDVGFDYSYLLAATQDRTPTVILENQKVVGLSPDDPLQVSYKENFPGEPTGRENSELLKMHPAHGHDMSIHNGISRIGYQRGGKSAMWVDEDLADVFTDKAKAYINKHKDERFFLYFALHQPHVPRTPHERFVGTSGMGPRGDVILEADWCVGEIVKELQKLGLDENTLVVFSSDNGPVVNDGYKDDSIEKLGDHTPAGVLRGGKYSLFDAGARVPFIVRWPGSVEPGVSDALVCQLDFFASFANLTGQNVPEDKDSQDVLAALTGRSEKGRDELVLEAVGNTCLRTTDWYYIPPHEGVKVYEQVQIESGRHVQPQLYNIKDDIRQQNNVATDNPDVVANMEKKYKRIMGEFYNPVHKKLELQ